jgi:hypothetical protein
LTGSAVSLSEFLIFRRVARPPLLALSLSDSIRARHVSVILVAESRHGMKVRFA